MNKKDISIEIDCNNDTVNLCCNNKLITTLPIKNAQKTIEFFSELFNHVINSDDTINWISIIKIDEDSSTTIEEW